MTDLQFLVGCALPGIAVWVVASLFGAELALRLKRTRPSDRRLFFLGLGLVYLGMLFGAAWLIFLRGDALLAGVLLVTTAWVPALWLALARVGGPTPGSA